METKREKKEIIVRIQRKITRKVSLIKIKIHNKDN